MKRYLVFILLFTFCSLYGQKQNNVWVFGMNSGFNFNDNPPTPVDSSSLKIKFPQYATSICDKQGKLLFYTDGENIYNRGHYKLLNFQTYWPWQDYVMPLFVPYPNDDSLFYLFGVSNFTNTLSYLTVDLKADWGMGGIEYPQPSTPHNFYTKLLQDCSLFVAATNHCNQKDKWVVTHKNGALYAYLVSSAGVNATPEITTVDPAILPASNFDKFNLKFSSSGEKMIFPLKMQSKMVVFDFDNFTGKFSNPLLLEIPANETLDDFEISPDGSKLYYSSYTVDPESGIELHTISQLDLNRGSKIAIENSRVNLSPYPDRSGCSPRTCFWVFRSMQLGPDGRIYVSLNDKMNFTNVIDEPNEPGIACTYNVYKQRVNRIYNTLNYNYNRSASYTPKENGIQVKKTNCTDRPVHFSLLYENVDSVRWNFGDVDAGARNTSVLLSPNHTYPDTGKYLVTAIIYHHCFTDTATLPVYISQNEVVSLPASIRDTVLCVGSEWLVDATASFADQYLWSDGITYTPQFVVKQRGTYKVRAQNECSLDEKQFTVDYQSCGCDIYVPNAFTPNKDGLNDVFRPVCYCYPKDYVFRVFSRLGNVIYSTRQVSQGWDGRMGSVEAGSGTYIWMLEYRDPNDKKLKRRTGTLVLIR